MPKEIKTYSCNDDEFFDTTNSENCSFMFLTRELKTISTGWQLNVDTIHVDDGNGIGDAPIFPKNMVTDGDIIITLGWADGLSVKRIENDGTFTTLFTDTGPHGYSGGTNLAVDKVNKKFYTGWYGSNSIEEYDYSDTGSIASVTVHTVLNAGYSFLNGFALAGDWLYLVDDDSTSVQRRWNTQTQTFDDLTVRNKIKNGYRGTATYIPERDWVVCHYVVDGGIWLTHSASFDNEATCSLIAPTGFGEDMDNLGAILDKDGGFYEIWLGGTGQTFAKFDIGNIITGSTETDPVRLTDFLYSDQDGSELWNWQSYILTSGHPVSGSDMLIAYADRATSNPGLTWYDKEHGFWVGTGQYFVGDWWPDLSSKYNPVSPTAQTQFRLQYGGSVELATSQNGTKYWIRSQYSGMPGYGHFSFVASTHDFALYPQSSTVFGDFTLDNGNNIGSIQLNSSQSIYVPSDCSVTVQVTNNDGSSWENYSWQTNEVHKFTSIGDTAKIKLIFNGQKFKCPYWLSPEGPLITIRERDFYESTSTNKIARNKIKGI